MGGLLCERHPAPPTEVSAAVARGAQAAARAIAAWTSRPSPALRLPPDVEAEVERLMRRFLRHVLEREARSLAFLDEIRT